MTRKALVTGGSGFVGRHVAKELLRAGYVVTTFERTPIRHSGSGVSCVKGDIRDESQIDSAVRGMNVVYHVAGNIRTPQTDRADLHWSTNVIGTQNVLAACKRHRVERLSFVSTCEVYGDRSEEGITEESEVCPASVYAQSKSAAEYLSRAAAGEGLQVTITRPAYVYGPGQFAGRLLPKLIRATTTTHGERLHPGSGGNDFIYVKDAARGIVFLGERTQRESVEIFNLGSGIFTSVREIFGIVSELTGYAFESPLDEQADLRRFSLCMARARACGYEPQYDLRRGLEDYLRSGCSGAGLSSCPSVGTVPGE